MDSGQLSDGTRRATGRARRAVAWWLRTATITVVGLVAALAATSGAGLGLTTGAPRDAEPQPRPRAELLLDRHGCWSGAQPADVDAPPTRAVVTLPGKRADVVPAEVGLSIWLDGAPGVLHGFCR